MSHLKLVDLHKSTLANIPAKLRELAETIEDGAFGNARECVVVLNAETLNIFGLGAENDGTVAHYLLSCAQRKMEQPMLDQS